MNVRYRVELSQEERGELEALLSGGKHAARKLKRAQILLAADARLGDEEIARTIGVSGSTVYRTRRRFVLGNLEAALSEEPRPGVERKLSGKEAALLVATACAKPPVGRARWTLELLAGAMVKLTEHGELSRETVRRRLAENDLKPWRRDTGRAGPARALRLRVSPQRHRQPVRLPRRPPALAHRQGHRPAHRPRLRRPLHLKARLLAQHGRDRDRRPARPVSRAPHRRPPNTRNRDRGLAAPAQRRPRPHQMDVHHPACPHQTAASLSRHRQRVIISVQRY